MAAPIISAIVQDPPSTPPGGTRTVTIQAHDPDTGSPPASYRFAGKATDSMGEVTEIEGTLNVDAVPGDTIVSYELIDVDNAGVTIVQDATQPNVFRVTVP